VKSKKKVEVPSPAEALAKAFTIEKKEKKPAE